MEKRIIICDGLEEIGLKILQSSAIVENYKDISAGDLFQAIAEFDAMIVRGRTRVTAPIINASPRLKVIGRAGVGVDNVDLEAARTREVLVVNTPTATSLAVAELALGLMLALSRAIPRGDVGMKNGNWLKKELVGIEISGKTLGIIGMGKIGSEVTRRARAFDMSILGYDPYLPVEIIQERGAKSASLEKLYQQSDFISVHIPLTPETYDLVNQAAFRKMKPGVRLICTARGGIINEAALLEALEDGLVAGAALDVFNQEPPGMMPLIAHPNVIATPHIGAQTREAQERAAENIAVEVLAALEGRPLRWRIE